MTSGGDAGGVDETREDDGTEDAPTDTCIVVRAAAERRVFEVRDHDEVIIGRSRDATFFADDDRVSRRHLRIAHRDGALWASNLGSRNGTTLNGRPLAEERALAAGDELEAGPVRVTVCGRRRADPICGEGEFHHRLVVEVERAVQFKRPLGVVGLVLRGPSVACREAILRVASAVRRTDMVGEYAAGRFLVLVPEATLARTKALAETWADTAREVVGVEASARAAAVPEDGAAADELVDAALGSTGRPTAAPADAAFVVAEDAATRATFELARRAARSNVTVLVVGETGSGKELVAAEIHRASARASGPYVRLNCAALPEALLESELFGHARGAFTGAERKRIGFVESAAGGTLFLDEIGEMPLGMQAKLLRVLEDRRVRRLGETEEIPVDVRFVAATNRDLEREVARGAFREDLYFRLSTISVQVPPLRDRPLDLARLAQKFASAAAQAAGRPAPRLKPSFLSALGRYAWPGNVRELKNVMERAVILAESDELGSAELPARVGAASTGSPPAAGPAAPAAAAAQIRDGAAPTAVEAPPPVVPGSDIRAQMDDLERKNVEQALREVKGSRTEAAKRLGISRRTLYYKLKKYGLEDA